MSKQSAAFAGTVRRQVGPDLDDVMRLHDEGASVPQIARRMGMTVAQARYRLIKGLWREHDRANKLKRAFMRR